MASTEQPIVPPRPQKDSQARMHQQAAANAAGQLDLPQDQPTIPPRPLHKTISREDSSSHFPSSPFNEPYGLTKTRSRDPIPRPPSVSRFPTSGEEGMEYGEIQPVQLVQQPLAALAPDTAAQTKVVGHDLKLHAPKPSLPTTSATAQVQAVTQTDSKQAVHHGIGRPPSVTGRPPSSQDGGEPLGRTRSRASIARPDSRASSDHRRSVFADEHDHGPAELGMRVPINPLLGDVQAPSPAPGLSPHHTGHGHESGRKRNHHRTRSGREQFLPPDSYGLHGHGYHPHDQFDRDWYAKHPDEAHNEEASGHGVYESIGSGRGAFALSSDDLNKLVRDTARGGHGFGTAGKTVSYPDEQIGYEASEQYSSRQKPTPLSKVPSQPVQSPLTSPLRKASLPAEDAGAPALMDSATDHPSAGDAPGVQVDAPERTFNKVTGGQTTMRETEPAKPYASHQNVDTDDEYHVPILAEDEVAKEVGYEHLHPAVSPAYPRRGSGYDEHGYHSSPHGSRPSSRPGSIYNMHSASHSLSRIISHHDDREHLHTPLEDVDEYEPLFPVEDGKRALTHAERFKKRPDGLRHKFPSQDIWEDTPDSVMYEATVSTPDLTEPESGRTSAFEPPEAEHARKGEVPEKEKKNLVPAEQRLAKSKHAPHLRDDMPTRPGLLNRFPSKDIWEDSPDSQYLETTVEDAEDEPAMPPTATALTRPAQEAQPAHVEPSVAPTVPPRPPKPIHAVPPVGAKLTDPSTLSKELSPPDAKPAIPDRPKPQVPARPAKKPEIDAAPKAPSTTTQESEETERDVTSPPVPKTKPQVPARPGQGSKIANLRSNFMNDLNQKLGLGPPKEKEPEPQPEPEDAKPLEDARKGRARGPQRRAPARSPAAPVTPAQPMSFSMFAPQSLWHIDDTGLLSVSVANVKDKLSEDKLAQIEHSTPADAALPPTIDTSAKTEDEVGKRPDDVPKPLAPALATNTAGEPADPVATETEDLSLSKITTATDVSGEAIDPVESSSKTPAKHISRSGTGGSEELTLPSNVHSGLPREETAAPVVEDSGKSPSDNVEDTAV